MASSLRTDLDRLPEGERAAVARLLAKGGEGGSEASTGGDVFRYRLSWKEDGCSHAVEVDESAAPESARSAAKDRLA